MYNERWQTLYLRHETLEEGKASSVPASPVKAGRHCLHKSLRGLLGYPLTPTRTQSDTRLPAVTFVSMAHTREVQRHYRSAALRTICISSSLERGGSRLVPDMGYKADDETLANQNHPHCERLAVGGRALSWKTKYLSYIFPYASFLSLAVASTMFHSASLR
ncbi:hypothetical protein J6590_024401 [Homalodisca vitripennis]|nr:hypothetical protein J6590_024401 [Homalodisca vitripennis]